MSQKKDPILEMINFDSDKMPTHEEPNVELINMAEGMPAIVIKRRKFEEMEEFYTMEAIEKKIKQIDDSMLMLETHKTKYLEILKWAKNHERVVALNEAEGHFFEFFRGHAEKLRDLEALEKPTPEQVLEKKKLKENMEKTKKEVRPAMLEVIEQLIKDILNANA